MKIAVKKIKSAIDRMINWGKTIAKEPSEFLQKGRMGGMVLCMLLASQFVYGDLLTFLMKDVPEIICFLTAVVLVAIVSELFGLLIRIVFAGKSRSRAYFIIAWLMLLMVNLIATQAHAVVPAIAMSFLTTVCVDVLGRCIWGMIKTRKFKQIFGYVAFGVSLSGMIVFGLFLHMDCFGENRIMRYSAKAPEIKNNEAAGFAEYLTNGTEQVSVLSYGPDEEADIHTESIDLSTVEKREGFYDAVTDFFSDRTFERTPLSGKIWYPANLKKSPVLFIVHGAHNADTPSYLGYQYLGEYLASNGYVVVSVDENIINELDAGNDVRAILLLENMKKILALNEEKSSPLYQKIDTEKVAIAGHSRGGEMVATAYLFNNLDVYPENGNVTFDYHFDISAVIAIAPTVDQYMPSGHAVEISDVDYLLIHGANDQDVSSMMGEKQYNNVSFSGEESDTYCKASVYIMGANHGQFNSEWGRYDLSPGTNGFLNTANFLDEADQKKIAKAYIRTFLDMSLKDDTTYMQLLADNTAFLSELPKTVYITDYENSSFEPLCTFDDSVDLTLGDAKGVKVRCTDMETWKIRPDVYGSGLEGENYVLECAWNENESPKLEITMPAVDLSEQMLSFCMADMREDIADNVEGIKYTVELTDTAGNQVSVEQPKYLYPSLALQLYKQDVLFGSYEYKHQMQTIYIDAKMFEDGAEFDFSNVSKMSIYFDGAENGTIKIDHFGVCEN